MEWYRIDMNATGVSSGALHRLCRDFQKAFIAAGAPPQMALYVKCLPQQGAREVFLSPGSTGFVGDLIERYDGRPCGCPGSEEVTLVYGVPEAVTLTGGSDLPVYRSAHTSEIKHRNMKQAV